MNNKTNQLRLILIVSALAVGMISAAAVPLLEQQAKAQSFNFNFGGGNFFHVNPNGHINFKFDGIHIH
jgi:hypothetical protein